MSKRKRFPGREIRLEGADEGFREGGDMRHGSRHGGADKPVLGASCQHALRFVDASWRFLGARMSRSESIKACATVSFNEAKGGGVIL